MKKSYGSGLDADDRRLLDEFARSLDGSKVGGALTRLLEIERRERQRRAERVTDELIDSATASDEPPRGDAALKEERVTLTDFKLGLDYLLTKMERGSLDQAVVTRGDEPAAYVLSRGRYRVLRRVRRVFEQLIEVAESDGLDITQLAVLLDRLGNTKPLQKGELDKLMRENAQTTDAARD